MHPAASPPDASKETRVTRSFKRFAGLASSGVLALALALVLGAAPARADVTGVGGVLEASGTLSGSYLAGIFAERQGDKDAAAEFFREALKHDPDNPVLLDRTFVLDVGAGNHGEAHDLAIRLLEVDPGHRLARMFLGVEAIRGRQFAEARRHFDEASRSPISDLTVALLSAWSLIGGGQNDQAFALVEEIDASPSDDIARLKIYHTALMHEVVGDTETARGLMRQAFEMSSSDLRVVQALIRYAAIDGDFEAASGYVAGFESLLPGHPLMQHVAADIAEGRVPHANVKDVRDGAVEVLFGLGAALARDARDDNAALFYQLALVVHPEAPMPLLTLGEHFDAVDDHEAAIATYERVPETSPFRVRADIRRARSLDNAEFADESDALMAELVTAHPDSRDVHFTRASILHGRRAFAEAAGAYTDAISTIETVRNEDWFLFYYRGICFERSKQWSLAEADLQRALELNPDQPYVMNYLGYSWIDQGVNVDEGLELVKRAVELRPRDGDIVDSLGWGYYRLGRYEEAVETLERAAELRGDEPVILDHLGDAYWKVGRYLEARYQWRHALDLEPEDQDLVETIRMKLDHGLADAESDDTGAEGNGG